MDLLALATLGLLGIYFGGVFVFCVGHGSTVGWIKAIDRYYERFFIVALALWAVLFILVIGGALVRSIVE